MMKRVIVLFPEFENGDLIEHLRSNFDPLASKVRAHITLIPPFESDILASQLCDHIERVIRNINPFRLVLQGITGHEGEYLVLNVKHGNDWLIALRDELYKDLLSPYFQPQYTYVPHLTIGRLPTKESFYKALKRARELQVTFETEVTEISIYNVLADGERPIEFNVLLKGR